MTKWFDSIQGHVTPKYRMSSFTPEVVVKYNGRNGWMLLIAGVTAWDILVADSLSEAFARAMRSRRSAPILTATWAVLTAHLFDLIPDELDPFHQVLVAAKRVRALWAMSA